MVAIRNVRLITRAPPFVRFLGDCDYPAFFRPFAEPAPTVSAIHLAASS